MRKLKAVLCLILSVLMITPIAGTYASNNLTQQYTNSTSQSSTSYVDVAVLIACENEAPGSIAGSPTPPVFVETEHQVGAKSMKQTGGKGASIWYDGLNVNVSDQQFDDLLLSFWVKSTDVSTFAGLSVILKSDNSNALVWWPNKSDVLPISNLWSLVVLKFSDASKNGNIDLSNIHGFAVDYGNVWINGAPTSADTSGVDFYFDDIKIIKMVDTSKVIHTTAADVTSVIACENETLGSVAGFPSLPEFVSAEKKVGVKSMKHSGGNGASIWYDGLNIDISAEQFNDLSLTFWMKSTDVSKFDYMNVVLKTDNNNGIVWWPNRTSVLPISNQWSLVILKFSDASKNGNMNLADINGFSLNYGTVWVNGSSTAANTTGVDFYFDDIKITKTTTQDRSVTLPNFYSDGMVFQQNKPIRIVGKTQPNTDITIALKKSADDSLVANTAVTSNANGDWVAQLPAQQASFTRYYLECSNGIARKAIDDLLIGEVWLASGQSNMEFKVNATNDRAQILANAGESTNKNYNIRVMSVASATQTGNRSYQPAFNVPTAVWKYGNKPTDVAGVSAVAYSFAGQLYDKLNVDNKNIPVAVIAVSRGATGIEAWMSRESIESVPVFKNTLNPYYNSSNWNTAGDKANQATAMFNDYLAPLTPLNISGFIWYQGENNYTQYETYGVALKAMINDWRARFTHDASAAVLPFVAIQIAPYNYNVTGRPRETEPLMWESQMSLYYDGIEKYATVPIYDLPLVYKDTNGYGEDPIHPTTKTPIGKRAAMAAYGLAYDVSKEYMSSVYKSMSVSGDKIILKFDHVGTGLKVKDGEMDLHGFAICGADRIFIGAKAKIIGIDTVEVWNDSVSNPVAATYAFAAMNSQTNLFNSVNMPAIPFRTDKISSTYYQPKDWQYCDYQNIWVSWTATNSILKNSADYMPTWQKSSITDNADVAISYDSTIKSEGFNSMKLSYGANTKQIGVGPVLEYKEVDSIGYPSTYNQFENFDRMSFDVYNPDNRSKNFTGVKVKLPNGNIYTLKIEGMNTGVVVIPASDQKWHTYTVDFDTMIDSNGVIVNNAKSIIADCRFMQFTFEDQQQGNLYIDNINFGFKADVDETNNQEPAHAKGGIASLNVAPYNGDTKMLLDCESTAGLSLWPGSGNAATPSLLGDAKVGSGSIKVPAGGTIQKFEMNISADDTYYLSFWVKSTSATNGIWHWSLPMIKIFTNGSTTNDYIAYWTSRNDLLQANTWTQIMLPITAKVDDVNAAVVYNGNVNLSNITGIQIDGRADGDMYIDDVKLVKAAAIQDSSWSFALPAGIKTSLDNADDKKGLVLHKTPVGGTYSGSALTGKLNGFTTDGKGSYRVAFPVGNISLQSIFGSNFTGIELSNARKQYLTLDLYLPSKNIISTDTTKAWEGKLTVAISYSGGSTFNDSDCMRWKIDPSKLNDGWNRLVLPLNYTSTSVQELDYATAERVGGGPNKDGVFAVNQYRIAFDSAASTSDMFLDNMNIIYTEGVAPTEITDIPSTSGVTDSSITIHWTKALPTANGTVGGYIITKEKNDVLFGGWVADGEVIKISGADVNDYKDTGLERDTEYRYTIKAVEDINVEPYNFIANYKVTNAVKTLLEYTPETPNTSSDNDVFLMILLLCSFGLLILAKKKRNSVH